MNRVSVSFIFVALMLGACSQGPVEAPPVAEDPADVIFFGDNIVTVDASLSGAKAVAVRGADIIAVGSRADILALQGTSTRVIELGDDALVPGFIDAHGHTSFVGRLIDYVNLSSPPVGAVVTMDDLVTLIVEHMESTQPGTGEWVVGYGYDDSLIAENRHPTRDDLDRASTEVPIMLTHVSGHLLAANSAALTAAGVDADSEDPEGGVIRRKPGTRVPDGVFEETAMGLIRAASPRNSDPARLEQMFRQSAEFHARHGITTVQDGGAGLDDIAIYRDAALREQFPVDIVAFAGANRLDDATLDSVTIERDYIGGFRVGGIKFVLDGSPQGRTAFLSQPYTEGPPGAPPDYRAYPSYPAEAYNERIARLIQAGKPVLAHANGDAAIDMMIDGVAAAVEGIELPDHRSVIIHAQLMRPDQLPLVKALGLVPSYYAAHPFFWGDWHRKSFGEERAAFISPLAATAELDIPFTIHNDSPVVPPDMMRLLWIAVNRKTRSGFVIGPDQRLTPEQALYAVTQGAAYQYFEEGWKGSITPGKRADLVILDANPLTIDPDAIKDIGIVETFARGMSVYRQQQ